MNIGQYELSVVDVETTKTLTIRYFGNENICIKQFYVKPDGSKSLKTIRVPRAVIENFLRMINEDE